MEFLKENIPEFLEKQENTVIYISSSLKNMQYYYSRLNSSNIHIFKTNSQDKKELVETNIRLIDILSRKDKNIIIIDFILAMSIFFDKVLSFDIKLGQNIKISELEDKLINYGYTKNYLLEQEGEYSIRGDIVDIFSPNNENPIRISFFDIEVEKIKFFDVTSQKSINSIDKVNIYSNNLFGNQIAITSLSKLYSDAKIFLENKELLEYNLENLIFLNKNKEEIYIKRYEEIQKNSVIINVLKTKGKNYEKDLINYKDNLSKKGLKYNNLSAIQKGDYVIHVQYGIGIYEGLALLNGKECLFLKYADEDKLYIPIQSLDRIEKYIGSKDTAPELYKLGRRGFKLKQKKLKQDIEQMAKQLLEIQAKRSQAIGISFIKDSIWQQEFEEGFEFEETADQKKAILEVKQDMQSKRVMDRVICGDVGYGKTEIAMRAAFKAIESGYQVVLLAPTTILANQHYERFCKRFENYPINIQVFSRMSTTTKDTSKADLIIGTHKILGNDFSFPNLGLLIIDEEQKFGVKAKEIIKNKKNNIDVLTLTATPIPRTLNLTLLGIRDISIISTPPAYRMPIKTEIITNIEERKLKKIILQELSRDGQVFYVSNDVANMPKKSEELQSILPDFVKVDYIHGKLPSKEIKRKINEFISEEFQVLLCSTIIENGIDISNANTIIIENFNKLGLSQIYQLRGRVGRSNRKAYCYLLRNENINKKGKLKQNSIVAIENVSGAGYRLSFEDMQIRGAGEILGDKQHGAIETFGYDLYIKLLNEEIEKQKGNKKMKLENVEIVLKNSGHIPSEYISDEERIKIYKRLSEASEISEVNEIEEEIVDIYGKLPIEVSEFLINIKARIFASYEFITKVYEKDNKIKLYYVEKSSLLPSNVVTLDKEEFIKIIS